MGEHLVRVKLGFIFFWLFNLSKVLVELGMLNGSNHHPLGGSTGPR